MEYKNILKDIKPLNVKWVFTTKYWSLEGNI